MANIVGTASSTTSYSARNLSKVKQAKLGYTAIGKIGKVAGFIGVAATSVNAIAEWNVGQANTHTIVDVGVCIVGLGLAGIATIFSLPELALGVAVVGTAYGIASVCGGSEYIDKVTNNWGRRKIYGYEEDY